MYYKTALTRQESIRQSQDAVSDNDIGGGEGSPRGSIDGDEIKFGGRAQSPNEKPRQNRNK